VKFVKRTNTPSKLSDDASLLPFWGILKRRRKRAEDAACKMRGKKRIFSKIFDDYKFFGLHCEKDEWVFREYAPHADSIVLTGDFSNWQLDSKYQLSYLGNGIWEGRFPYSFFSCGMHYKMFVRWSGGSGLRIPAYARYVVQDSVTKEFAAVICKDKKFTFKYSAPPPAAPIIYESHIGIAQEEEKVGSYSEFREKILPVIAEKGYNTVQLMGIMEHPYYGSFGYHVANFYAVSSRFGTPEDFKELVDEAHRLGLRVIIDLVHSHSVKNITEGLAELDGCRSTYFHEGERGEHPAWDSLCFNYGDERVLRFLLSNCRYFLEEFNIDGFRFDGVTSMLYRHHGLNRCFVGYDDYFSDDTDDDALTYLTLANKLIHEIRPDAVTIAEDVSGMPGLASPDGIGFDYRMAMGVTDWWFKMLDIPDEQWSMFQLWGELLNRRNDEKSISYVECHDQAIVGGQSSMFRMTGADIYCAMHKNSENIRVDRAVALHKLMRLITAATAGHGYLNFMGNEFGHPEWVDLPREGNNWSYHHARRQWHLEKDPALRFGGLSAFDREITAIIGKDGFYERPVQSLRVDDNAKIIAFERDNYWFFFNFHWQNACCDYEIEVLRGSYCTVLDSDEQRFGGFGLRQSAQDYFTMERDSGEVISLYLPPRTALVLKRKN
jgi:1,4-alpha-glucan branching enzyme